MPDDDRGNVFAALLSLALPRVNERGLDGFGGLLVLSKAFVMLPESKSLTVGQLPIAAAEDVEKVSVWFDLLERRRMH